MTMFHRAHRAFAFDRVRVIRNNNDITISFRRPLEERIAGTLVLLFYGWGPLLILSLSDVVSPPFNWLVQLIAGLVSVVVLYLLLASLLNTTRLYISQDMLVVHEIPVPMPRKVSLSVPDIERIHCTAIEDEYGGVYNALVAVLFNGTQVRLLSGSKDAYHMRFIGQEISKHLGRELYILKQRA